MKLFCMVFYVLKLGFLRYWWFFMEIYILVFEIDINILDIYFLVNKIFVE